MRLIEFSLSILTIIAATVHLFPRISKPLYYRISTAALILISGAQLIYEGFRWQLWSLFVGTVLLIMINIKRSVGARRAFFAFLF